MSSALEGFEGTEIAVVGMAGRFPGAADLASFWRNLRQGVESVRILTAEELAARGVTAERLRDPAWVAAVAEMPDPDRFDAELFGINHREAEVLDPQHRVLLELAWEALEDAGYEPEGFAGPVGVFAGATTSTYLIYNLMRNAGVLQAVEPLQLLVGNSVDTLATRVSYKLNLSGPSHALQCACSTSLLAVHQACQSLLAEECDMALAGGVSINVGQRGGYRFQEGSIVSPDGHCRPYDARARGTIFGSGGGLVVLRRLADAVAAGDPVRAVIRASAVNNDGSAKVGFTAPSVEGQAKVITEALAVAGVDPESISYLEGHGTATQLGDPIEIQALTKAYRAYTDKTGFCALGSVKSNVGHLDIAAGVAGLIKTVLALEAEEIPPSLHFEEPNPEIDFAASPLRVVQELTPWPRTDGRPRRAAVSSFGFGGTNVHLILEEAPAIPAAPEPAGEAARPWHLLPLSARSPEALEAVTRRLGEHLQRHPELPLADVAFTLQAGRRAFRQRRIVVARDAADAAQALQDPEGARQVSAADRQDLRERPVFFLFPGQGSQYPGMGRELYRHEEPFRRELDRCAEGLAPHLGRDLRRLLFPPPEGAEEAAARLAETALTQPALFAVEYALARLWESRGIAPRGMLGHSIGELVAACLAGVFSLEDGLALVAARGRLMGECEAGAMLAVPLPEAELAPLLAAAGDLALAAVNAPASCVVSGPAAAVEELARQLAGRGVETRRLHTSHAFHSAAMEPAVERFAAELRRVTLSPPEIPFVSNLSGTWIRPEEATDPDYWARQLRRPVRFAAGVSALLAEEGEGLLLEVGPGRALTTLVRQRPGASAVFPSLPHPRDAGAEGASDLAFFLTALGRVWLAGRRIDWAGPGSVSGGRRRLSLPTYPFQGRRYWIEPGDGAAAVSSVPEAPAGGERRDPEEWFYLPSWKLSMAPPAAAVEPESWLVFTDAAGPGEQLGERLVERLTREGHTVTAVHPGDGPLAPAGEGAFRLDPGRGEDYAALLRRLAAEGGPPRKVVHLWGMSPAGAGEPAAGRLARAAELGLDSLLHLARALEAEGDGKAVEITVVAGGLAAVQPGDPVRPEAAPLLAAVKVLPQELPRLACRAVDLQPAPGESQDGLAELLAAELAGDGEELVAYRGDRRWVAAYEPVRLAAGARPRVNLEEGGVYALTGGLEGAGLALARRLAQQHKARLVLLEEAGFPPRESWDEPRARRGDDDPVSRRIARARELESLGAELLVVAAELEEEGSVAAALAAGQERFAPLAGLFHAAGATAAELFQPVLQLTPELCRRHLAARARELEALAGALAATDAFCVAFSSLFAVLGGPGAALAAAADLYLDAFVEARRQAGESRWRAVDWDVWRLEDQPELMALLPEELARQALSPEEGTGALERILAAATVPRIVVSTTDLAVRLRRWRESAGGPAADGMGEVGSLHARPDVGTAYVAPDGEVEATVAEIWGTLLGIDRVGRHDNFFDLGGHSLLSTQLASRLKQAFGVEFPLESLFTVPTVAGQAGAVETLRWAAEGPARMAAAGVGSEREEGEL